MNDMTKRTIQIFVTRPRGNGVMIEMGEERCGMVINAVSVMLQVLSISWKRKVTAEAYLNVSSLKA